MTEARETKSIGVCKKCNKSFWASDRVPSMPPEWGCQCKTPEVVYHTTLETQPQYSPPNE